MDQPQTASNSPWAQWSQAFLGTQSLWSFPTADLEQLEKKIKELRTVLGWMEMQCKMLEMTIHALEVQQGTVRALQSLHIKPELMREHMSHGPAAVPSNAGAKTASSGEDSHTLGEAMAPIQQWWQEALQQTAQQWGGSLGGLSDLFTAAAPATTAEAAAQAPPAAASAQGSAADASEGKTAAPRRGFGQKLETDGVQSAARPHKASRSTRSSS